MAIDYKNLFFQETGVRLLNEFQNALYLKHSTDLLLVFALHQL